LIPPILIFGVVIGSIYSGLATPTESAALGVISALVLAATKGNLGIKMLLAAFEGTLRTTAMIMLIVVASFFLNFVMAAIGLIEQVNAMVTNLDLAPTTILIIIIIFYIIMGLFMETLSMMIATLPIVAPIIIDLGYDPVWFGVLMMVLVETALITPPVGMNLFIVQSVRRKGNINEVMLGALPFAIMMFVMIVLLIVFPSLALWYQN
jgi:tripartite ATP-independent transporter DctM subunit